jgi:hypothetical protein
MITAVSRPTEQTANSGRLRWLPAGGYGNGLDDDMWTPVLEISERVVAPLLRTLAEASVPAYAAPAHSGSSRLRAHSQRPEDYQLWVGASAYGRAEMALLTVMPRLAGATARHGDSAWR